MSERLPYEEQLPQQLRDFPLPDEDAAWADMKRRLEEDEDDGIIVWWRKGCLGWGLLLLALIGIGVWLFISRNKNEIKSETVIPQKKIDSIGRIQQKRLTDSVDINHNTGTDPRVSGQDSSASSVHPSSADTVAKGRSVEQGRRSGDEYSQQIEKQRTDKNIKEKRPAQRSSPDMRSPGKNEPLQTITTTNKPDQDKQVDSAAIERTHLFIAGDPSRKAIKDSLKKTPQKPFADSAKKKEDKKQSAYFFSAGLGLSQQLPVAGQKAVQYSSQGRNFSLADYIPSVYARFNKKDRWFIQGEFRYGAPQYNKPLTYDRIEDTIPNGDKRITEKQLQKTYYHQLPFSFNFYIRPEWAVGAGFVWNKFSRSIFQQTLADPQIDTLLSKEIFVGKNAAAEGLSKSYFQALFESQYQWKRFSFGARYTFGLSPYIRFTLPGEPEQRERNQSLQLFIRYQLLKKSKK